MASIPPPNLLQSASGIDELGYNARIFLNTSYSINDYNARRLFLELTGMPSRKMIREYVANELVHHWIPVFLPSANGIVFYTVNPDTKEIDSTVAHTVDDIHADYLRRVRTVRQNVRRFISQRGSTFFVDIARNPNRSDNEKIQEIIDIRLSENLPMKEPMGWDNDDFIEYGFSRRVRISNASENLIRAAARLPPI